jgi:hypothetical protein
MWRFCEKVRDMRMSRLNLANGLNIRTRGGNMPAHCSQDLGFLQWFFWGGWERTFLKPSVLFDILSLINKTENLHAGNFSLLYNPQLCTVHNQKYHFETIVKSVLRIRTICVRIRVRLFKLARSGSWSIQILYKLFLTRNFLPTYSI